MKSRNGLLLQCIDLLRASNNLTEDLYSDYITFFELNAYIFAFSCGRSLFFTPRGSVDVGLPGMQNGEICASSISLY
jgi:hypothetical protein